MSNKISTSFAKIGIIYTLSNFIIKGMAFLTTPIFTRLMNQSEYGEFSSIASWANIISIIVTLSLYSSISRAKYDYNECINEYMSSITALGSLVTIFFWIFIELNINTFVRIFEMKPIYIRSIMLYSVFSPAVQTLIAKYRMYNEYKKVVILTWVSLLSSTFASLILTYCMEDKLQGRVLGTYVVVAVVDIVFWLLILIQGKKFSLKMCYYACAMSLPLLIHELSGVLLNSSDRIIIKQLCGAKDVALYSIAYTIAMIITVLLSSLNQAWVPWFFDKLDQKKLSEIKDVANKYTLLFSLGCIGLMLVGPELIMIFGGKDYISAKYVIPPVCLAVEMQFIYTLYVNIEFFLKKTMYISVATALATAINIILNYLLIPHGGYVVAAYTTVAGYLAALIFHSYVCHKTEYKHLFDEKRILKYMLFCIISMFSVLFLYHLNYIRYMILTVLTIIFIIVMIRNKWKIKQILNK